MEKLKWISADQLQIPAIPPAGPVSVIVPPQNRSEPVRKKRKPAAEPARFDESRTSYNKVPDRENFLASDQESAESNVEKKASSAFESVFEDSNLFQEEPELTLPEEESAVLEEISFSDQPEPSEPETSDFFDLLTLDDFDDSSAADDLPEITQEETLSETAAETEEDVLDLFESIDQESADDSFFEEPAASEDSSFEESVPRTEEDHEDPALSSVFAEGEEFQPGLQEIQSFAKEDFTEDQPDAIEEIEKEDGNGPAESADLSEDFDEGIQAVSENEEEIEESEPSDESRPAGRWFLRHINTGVAVVLTGQGLLIGSSPRSDYVIEFDSSISKVHLQLTLEDNKVFARDLGSTNRSYIEYRVINEKTELKEEQILRLGYNQVFEVRFYEEDE